MIRFSVWNRAIPAFVVGIAFFLAACHARVPTREAVERESPPDRFAAAEAHLNKGELPQALEAYEAFLQENPSGEHSAQALHHMAEIYFHQDRYEKALECSSRIVREFPDYPELASVRYRIIESLYRLGRYSESKNEAAGWIDGYAGHRLEGEVLVMLGRNASALSDEAEAFHWWLKAKEHYKGNPEKEGDLHQRLTDLIKTAGVEDLEQFAIYAAGSDYAPEIYYRIALAYLEGNDIQKARGAAMALVRSTPDTYWVSIGRQLLERIASETSVKKNVVGCLLPLSGPFAIYGQEVVNGIQLGLSGEPGSNGDLEVVLRDTEGDATKAAAEVEELATKEKVVAIIGPLSSKAANAASGKAQQLGVPIVTLTQKENVTEEGDMVFRNFLTPSSEVKRLLDMAVDGWNIKRFAILYPENSYGRFLMNLFWDRLEEKGGRVTAVESYSPEETDFAEQIKKMTGLYYPRPSSVVKRLREMRTPYEEETKIYRDEPEPIIDFEAVFIPDNFQKIAMIAPQLVYHDVTDVVLMGTSLWQSSQLLETARDYLQGAVFSSGFFAHTGDSRVEDFVSEYKANFDADPGILAATGYDTIRFFKTVLSSEEIHTRRDFRDAMLRCRDFQGVTGNISFDDQGEVMKKPFLLTVSGRHFALVP